MEAMKRAVRHAANSVINDGGTADEAVEAAAQCVLDCDGGAEEAERVREEMTKTCKVSCLLVHLLGRASTPRGLWLGVPTV